MCDQHIGYTLSSVGTTCEGIHVTSVTFEHEEVIA